MFDLDHHLCEVEKEAISDYLSRAYFGVGETMVMNLSGIPGKLDLTFTHTEDDVIEVAITMENYRDYLKSDADVVPEALSSFEPLDVLADTIQEVVSGMYNNQFVLPFNLRKAEQNSVEYTTHVQLSMVHFPPIAYPIGQREQQD